MSNRFDNRSVSVFKKDIKFSTQLESYFFNRWVNLCNNLNHVSISNPRDNGVDNTGGFIESGKTSGADYMIDLSYENINIQDMPIEIKWVPTYGKLTLKEGDLKAYVKENAAILFVYLCKKIDLDLRMPKNYNLKSHIKTIESVSEHMRWAIMTPDNVKNFLNHARENNLLKSIPYMGYKMGVVLKQSEFQNWFREELWSK